MKTAATFIFLFFLSAFSSPKNFLDEQKKFERVSTAIIEKEKIITSTLASAGLESENFHMLIVAFKEEDILSVFVKSKTDNSYKKLKDYSICSRSGVPGPKRRQGDYQVPEGYYHIDRFNPVSNFYLSLGVSYPNQSDKKKSKAANLGGDVFIHGSCVTIGCLPMTNDKIKEIYLYAVHARNNGQSMIPVYIFPFKMNSKNFSDYCSKYKTDTGLIGFWSNLKTGYDLFEKGHEALSVSVDASGNYVFNTH
jgi:murein L,D-transpeptidase YafK